MEFLNWGLPYFAGFPRLIILLVVAWEAVWKGIALWRAGRNGHLIWFISLFILNTAGILPIIYIFAFSRKGDKIPQQETKG
jgi:methionyl-tRNA synthetase